MAAVAVCSERNTLCGQNIELVNVKCDGTQANH